MEPHSGQNSMIKSRVLFTCLNATPKIRYKDFQNQPAFRREAEKREPSLLFYHVHGKVK
jgi:hypothetical protein